MKKLCEYCDICASGECPGAPDGPHGNNFFGCVYSQCDKTACPHNCDGMCAVDTDDDRDIWCKNIVTDKAIKCCDCPCYNCGSRREPYNGDIKL